ncbi:MAG TPA: bifunctional hydroxymethylpyrimidine kinase/phosphomethylpyrimidine kinase [Chryseolinea sp.]
MEAIGSDSDAIIVVGGLDPSTYAGIIRDCITISKLGGESIAISTCLTFQNHHQVYEVQWLTEGQIAGQLDAFDLRRFRWAKIGALQSHDLAKGIMTRLKQNQINVVWDPVFNATSGYVFFKQDEIALVPSLLQHVNILTPNINECQQIFETTDPYELRHLLAERWPSLTVILKSGHASDKCIQDRIITSGEIVEVCTEKVNGSAHGTGCVFASAIAAAQSKKHTLREATLLAQWQVRQHIINAKKSDL